MNEPGDPLPRLDELLERMLGDGLSAEEHEELNQLLRDSLSARQHFMQYLHVDARLAWDHARRQQEGAPAQIVERFRAAIQSGEVDRADLFAGDPPVESRAGARGENAAPGRASNDPGKPEQAHETSAAQKADAPDSPKAPRAAPLSTGLRGLVQDFTDQPGALLIFLLVLAAGAALVWNLSTKQRPPVVQQQPPADKPPAVAVQPDPGRNPGVPNQPGTGQRVPGLSIARLTGVANARWDGTAWKVGTELHAGQRLVVKAGLAEITFHSGATVLLEGPANFEVGFQDAIPNQKSSTSNSCSLRLGKLVAQVPKQARGFVVATPSMTIVDLGTEFCVEVTSQIGSRKSESGTRRVESPTLDLQPPTATEVHVLQGEVSIHAVANAQAQAPTFERRPPTSTPPTLKAGQAVVGQRGGASQIILANPKKFVRALPAERVPAATDEPLRPGDILTVSRRTLKLVKVDPKTGAQTVLARGDRQIHGVDWICVAVDAQRRVYVGTETPAELQGGQVLRIDPRDGAIAVVASGGLMQAGRINGLAVAADGKLLATQDGPQDRILAIDPASGAVTPLAEFGDNAWGIAMDTNGRDAFVVSDGGKTALARLHDGALSPWLSYEDPRNYRGVAVRPDGRVFVSFMHLDQRNVAEVDRKSHRLTIIASLPRKPESPVGLLAVAPGGDLIMGSYGVNGKVFRIDVANKAAQMIAEGENLEASGGVAVVPDTGSARDAFRKETR